MMWVTVAKCHNDGGLPLSTVGESGHAENGQLGKEHIAGWRQLETFGMPQHISAGRLPWRHCTSVFSVFLATPAVHEKSDTYLPPIESLGHRSHRG